MKTVLLTFCCDLDRDPVSARVLERVLASQGFEEQDLHVDGRPVLTARRDDATFHLLRLDTVLSHAYERYAPVINERFGDVDAVVIVNWHEGAKAPDAIFTVQTTGDMGSGTFSPVDPRVTRGLYLAIERERVHSGLDSFSTWMEATHWSGVVFGGQPGDTVGRIRPSVIDVEIGSRPQDWSEQRAVDVLAAALFRMFETWDTPVRSLFCMGGVHFDPAFTQAVRDHGERLGVAVSHILPNHWLVAEGYDDPQRFEDLLRCARSIKGGVDTVVFHDNLKGAFKDQAKRLGETLGVPVKSHKKYRNSLLEAASA